MSATNEATERRQYLEFALGGGGFGVDILKVKEILQHDDVTLVPSTPRSIRGVINLRGRVVPVVDLAIRCGLPETAVTKRSCILVVETAIGGAATVMGLKADSVSQVVDLGAGDIEATPVLGTNVRVEYLVGVARVDGRLVLLLDIDRVLSAEDRDGVRLAAAPAAAAPATDDAALATGDVAQDGAATGARAG